MTDVPVQSRCACRPSLTAAVMILLLVALIASDKSRSASLSPMHARNQCAHSEQEDSTGNVDPR